MATAVDIGTDDLTKRNEEYSEELKSGAATPLSDLSKFQQKYNNKTSCVNIEADLYENWIPSSFKSRLIFWNKKVISGNEKKPALYECHIPSDPSSNEHKAIGFLLTIAPKRRAELALRNKLKGDYYDPRSWVFTTMVADEDLKTIIGTEEYTVNCLEPWSEAQQTRMHNYCKFMSEYKVDYIENDGDEQSVYGVPNQLRFTTKLIKVPLEDHRIYVKGVPKEDAWKLIYIPGSSYEPGDSDCTDDKTPHDSVLLAHPEHIAEVIEMLKKASEVIRKEDSEIENAFRYNPETDPSAIGTSYVEDENYLYANDENGKNEEKDK